jgi:hypothetical protein
MGSKSVFRALVVITAILTFAAGPAIEARTGASNAASRHADPASCTPGKKACPIRINFAPGAYSGQASSTLHTVFQKRWFVVSLQKHQEVTLWVIGAGPTRGIFYDPSGTALSGGPGGRIYDDQVHATGDFKIQASESMMGEQWSGKVTVLVVAI